MTIGRSLLAYLPVNLANVLVSFGTIVVLTRLLTSDEFGRYAIAIITMNAVHIALFTWLEAAAARYQARAEHEDNVNSHLRALYVTAALISLSGLALVFAFHEWAPISQPLKTVIAFAVASTCAQVFFNLGLEAHRASHRITRYSLTYSSTQSLSFLAGVMFVLLTPLREVGPILGIWLGIIFGLLIDLPFMLRRQRGGQFELERIKRYARYGIPITASVLLGYALNSADVFIIAGLMGEAAAGQYNAGYNLSNRTLEILFIWMSMAATPMAITAIEKTSREETQTIMRQYGASLLAIALPAAVGIALVAEDAGFILGESVRDEAVSVMPWIAFAGLINGLITYYVHRAFMLSGRTGAIVWLMVPAVVINVALNFMLIPTYGLMGAVVATLISYGFAFLVSVWLARTHFPLPIPLIETAKISVSCAAMAGAIWFLPLGSLEPGFVTLMIKASLGGAVYIALALTMNVADSRNLILALKVKLGSSPALEAAE